MVLTPGVHNSAHYEHAFLARHMGIELVEGRDLYCRDSTVWMRTTSGPEPVHVIYRRIDDDFLDPVHLLPDSVLGIPGVVNAARAGRVTIANAIGNGVADDKAVYPYVPAFIRYYLNEEPILPNVDTFDLSDADQRAWVLDRLDRMVVKPSDASGGYGLMMGPWATDEQLAPDAVGGAGQPARLDRPARRDVLDLPDGGRGRPASRRATSTCGRSPSTTAPTCSCCPAGSAASRCRRAASS